MAIETDIAIDGSGNIYYTGAVHGAAGAGYYTVIINKELTDASGVASDTRSYSGDQQITGCN